MNKILIAASLAAFLAVIGVHSSRAQDASSPFKVTGGGVYQHFIYPDGPDWWPSDEEIGQFAISINPDKKAGKNSPQAVIDVDGPKLREVWGGPLHIEDDWVDWFPAEPFRPEDLKPGQGFIFLVEHAIDEQIQPFLVFIFVHDNCTPGYNKAEDPVWSDWLVVAIEPLGGDLEPGTADDLFFGEGIVTHGNIMDHRK